MSLQTRLAALISAIGADIKQLKASTLPGIPGAYVVDSAGSTSVTIPLDASIDQWDLIVEGTLAAGGTQMVQVQPNGSPGNAGNLIRSTRVHWYTDATGAEGSAQGRMDEKGFPLAWSVFTASVEIFARQSFSTKVGRRRIARTQAALVAADTTVNQTETQLFVSRMDDTTTPITTIKVDFGGVGFTGRVVLIPSGMSTASVVSTNSSTPIVTALPTTGPSGGALVDGQECYFKPDPTNQPACLWHLKYNASDGYWYYLGGDWLRKDVSTANQTYTTTSGAWVASPTPASLTVPLSGDYLGQVGNAYCGPNTNSSYDCGISIAGATPSFPWQASLTAGAGGNLRQSLSRTPGVKTGLTAGQVLSHKYNASGNGANDSPFIAIRPTRVH